MELVAPDLELFRGHKSFGELFHDGGSHAYVRQTDFRTVSQDFGQVVPPVTGSFLSPNSMRPAVIGLNMI